MRTFSDTPLPAGLLDQWKRWERGRNRPDEYYRPLIAATLGTVVESIFPTPRVPTVHRSPDDLLLSRSGMDTHELVQRIRRSSVDPGTLDALKLTVDRLCIEYAHRNTTDLITESREWLSSLTRLLDQRLTLFQHRDVLDAAGRIALLTGCLEQDMGDLQAAEATRLAALHLGTEADNRVVIGWAHEMRAWFALTRGRYREVIAAAQAGQDAAPRRSVSVQLFAQEAKAWARMGNRRNVTRALENGRVLLDSLPYPDNPGSHFEVDPDKFDYYAMDCYRLIGDNSLADMHARETLRKAVAPNGAVIAPMRKAESEMTLGVVAARSGDLRQAVHYGFGALSITRRSLPSLLMVGSELDQALQEQFPTESATRDFNDALAAATSDASQMGHN